MTLTEQILCIDEEKIDTLKPTVRSIIHSKKDSLIHHQNEG